MKYTGNIEIRSKKERIGIYDSKNEGVFPEKIKV